MKIIGITGVARSGKDTLCQLLKERFQAESVNATRFALADELKFAMESFLWEKVGVNVWECSTEEKELIRPLLVEFGRAMRIKSKGTHWTSLVENAIELSTSDVGIVTDIRYKEYDFDEADWLKSLGGILIHLTRKLPDGTEVLAPNEDERKNDPILKGLADITVKWETSMKKAEEAADRIFEEVKRLWN